MLPVSSFPASPLPHPSQRKGKFIENLMLWEMICHYVHIDGLNEHIPISHKEIVKPPPDTEHCAVPATMLRCGLQRGWCQLLRSVHETCVMKHANIWFPDSSFSTYIWIFREIFGNLKRNLDWQSNLQVPAVILPFLHTTPITDAVFCTLAVLHSHWGIEAIVVDYIRPVLFGGSTTIPNICVA